MRMAFGFLFLFHGLQKTLGLFGGRAVEPASLLGVAGIIETVAGRADRGRTRHDSRGTDRERSKMAVAYFLAHQLRAVWPIENGGELAALYSFAFLLIATRGAGIWSVESLAGRDSAAGPRKAVVVDAHIEDEQQL